MKRLSRRGAVGVALATGAVHLVLAAVSGSFATRFGKYLLAARQRLAGDLPVERLIDFSPLYLELATLVQKWTSAPEVAFRALHLVAVVCAAGALATWLQRGLPRGVVLFLAVLFAVDPRVLVHAGIAEPEILLLALTCLWLALVDRRPVAAGVLGALAVATRPTVLPVVLLAPFARRLRRGRWDPPRTIAAGLCPVLVVLALLAVRAERATGSFRSPGMNPGTVFFEGNQPLSRGTSAVYPRSVLELMETRGAEVPDEPHLLYREIARATLGESADVAAVNAWWSARIRTRWSESPLEALASVRRKLGYAFHSYGWHDVAPAWRAEKLLPIPSLPFGLLAALALVGLIVEARRWRRQLLPLALAATQLAVLAVFYVSERQRILWLPAVLWFAGRGLLGLARARGARRLLLGALVGLLVVASLLPDAAMLDEEHRRAGDWQAERLLLEVRKRTESAPPLTRHEDLLVEALARAPWWIEPFRPAHVSSRPKTLEERIADRLEEDLDEAPDDPRRRFDLARVSLLAQRSGRAEELFRSLLDGDDRPVYRKARHASSVRWHLARIARDDGRTAEARRWLTEAREIMPGDPWVLADLAVLAADDTARAELFDWWGPVDGRLFLGRALLDGGDAERAAPELAEVVRRLPRLREARLDLAVALGRLGALDAAIEHLETALRQRDEPLHRPTEIVETVAAWRDRAPDDPRRVLLLARVLAAHGSFEQAAAVLGPAPAEASGLHDEQERLRRAIEGARAVSASGS